MKKYILALLLCSIGVTYAQTEGAGKYAINELTVNTKNSDFGTAFYGEDKLVFASPKKGISLVNDVWVDNNQRYLELYIGDILPNGDLDNVSLMKGEVNTRYHEADVVFTRDLKTVYFTRNNFYNKKLARSEKEMTNLAMFKASINENGEWVNIIPMPFNNVEYSVGHPALSPDEKTLYFISDMPGGYGQTDIFKVAINQSGFGNPENLGWKINSSAKEFSPFVDGEVLYFSSDKDGGMGGFDVYATRLVDYTPEPILLNAPINSKSDDFTFIINSKTRKGYVSSNRSGGTGDDDIYSFIEEEPVVFKCSQLITGEVRDQNTTEIIRGAVVAIKDLDGNVVEEVVVDEEGVFELPVYCDTSYKLEGSKEGYTTQSKSLTTSMEADKKLKLLILLGTGEILEQAAPVAIVEDKPEGLPEVLPEEIVKVRPSTYVVNIEPIYFELNSSYLNKDAKVELDKVIDLMHKYPDMIIESGSHTDARGIVGYNTWLSTRRASSTVNYIIDSGIDPSRITGKGYGETQLINGCADGVECTEAQHAMNRRTEFVIIKM
ncbi:OmpA family protein [Lutimonas halocynthiae]|uniref:OmpA family protein n=1 Tax=Lutimonas halocynthiae TaxID=1446477 RepID=UPI0025B3421E|nr:OmpA family protein [Lutimonas halocynthiae]MDN3643138.1 OmpA family protein [Lutimonas halocynthiae]